jgi:hypothetical protein
LGIYFSFYFASLFFLICSLDKYCKIISNKIVFFLTITVLLLFAGFRYGIATDYWSYHDIFYKLKNTERFEFGFLSLIDGYKIFFLSNSYNGFVFFIAFLSIGLKWLYFKKLKYPFFALAIYIALFYIHLEYNVIRQGLAVSIIYFAVTKAHKKYLYFLLVALATSMHTSSALFFPLYILCTKKISLSINSVIFFIIATVCIKIYLLEYIFNFIISLLHGRLSYFILYFKNREFEITSGFIRRLFIILIFIFLSEKKQIKNSFFNFYFLGFIMFILFSGYEQFAYRMSLCFDVFMIPLFANLKLKSNFRTIVAISMLLIILFFTYWLPLRNGYAVPYQTYLF